jgi:RNA polymerase sigma factor (sigma-70 family)
MTDGTNTKAWAWVLEHASLIRNTAWKAKASTTLDRDDLHSELIVRVVEKFDNYNQTLGSAKTWLYWQARAVVSRQMKAKLQNTHTVLEIGFNDKHNGHKQMMARAELSIIRPLGTKDEWDALFARVAGLTVKEQAEKFGVYPQTVNVRTQRLSKKIQRRG